LSEFQNFNFSLINTSGSLQYVAHFHKPEVEFRRRFLVKQTQFNTFYMLLTFHMTIERLYIKFLAITVDDIGLGRLGSGHVLWTRSRYFAVFKYTIQRSWRISL